MKPNDVASTTPASSAVTGPRLRRVQITSTSTVSQAATTEISRSAMRLLPKTLNVSAMSHTFSGGLVL